MPGPFEEAAVAYAEAGHVVIPTGGDDGKVALVGKYQNLTPVGALARTRRWARDPRFAHANIGLLLAPSNLVVVDVDHPDHQEEARSRFGNTTAWQSTPRGGIHLFYRARGDERATNLKPALDIDLKAGAGAYVLVAPSARPDTGKTYSARRPLVELLSGDLPYVDEGSWPRMGRTGAVAVPADNLSAKPGTRNNFLFDRALKLARQCQTYEELERKVLEANSAFSAPPLGNAEVARIVTSVWKYKCEGTLMVPGDGWHAGHVSRSDLDLLRGDAATVYLLNYLRAHHAPSHRFAVSPKGLHKVMGLDHKTIMRARDRLLAVGLLKCVYSGGRGPHDPSQYVFGAAAL